MRLARIVVRDVDERTCFVHCFYASRDYVEAELFYTRLRSAFAWADEGSPIATVRVRSPDRPFDLQEGDFYVVHEIAANRGEGSALVQLLAGLCRLYDYVGKICYVRDSRLSRIYVYPADEHAWVLGFVEEVDADPAALSKA